MEQGEFVEKEFHGDEKKGCLLKKGNINQHIISFGC